MFNINKEESTKIAKIAVRINTETYSKEEQRALFKIDIDQIVSSPKELETLVKNVLKHDSTFISFVEGEEDEWTIRELIMKDKHQKVVAEYEDDKLYKKVCMSFYTL